MSKSAVTPTPQRVSLKPAHYETSTGPDAVAVTAYQYGAAVVHETRNLGLKHGHNQISLEGMPAQMAPSTLTVLGYEGEGKISIGQTSYRPANLDKQRVLNGTRGKNITVTEKLPNGHSKTISGKLVAAFGNELVIEQNPGSAKATKVMVSTGGPGSHVILEDGIPFGLSDSASLTMGSQADTAGAYKVNFLYEAGGIGWEARHSAFYDAKRGVLSSFETSVSLTNNSGATFRGAEVKLVAGGNESRSNRGMRGMAMAAAAPPMGGARAHGLESADAAVETVGESQMYSLSEKVTLPNGEMQQVTLQRAKDVPVTQEYFLPLGHYQHVSDTDGAKMPVSIRLRASNSEDAKLGKALPAGEVNIFQPDSRGVFQKTGTSAIRHIAAGEKFKLEFGPVSEIKAVRRLTKVEDIEEPVETPPSESKTEGETITLIARVPAPAEKEQPKVFRHEHRELVIFNYKDEPVEVIVSEYVHDNAEWLKGKRRFSKVSPSEHSITVTVGAKGETTVSYALRYRIR